MLGLKNLELAILALGFLLGLISLPRLLVERRDSTATLSWLLAILFIPFLGLLAYWLFGSVRIKRVRRRKARVHHALAEASDRSAALPLKRFARPTESRETLSVLETAMRLADRISKATATSGNRFDLLLDGDAAFAAIEEAIRSARHHVHVEFYIYRPDGIGTRIRDLLIEKLRQGVEVRLLYDHAGSFSLKASFLAPLVAAGGEVAAFLPVLRISRRFNMTLRNHRKIVVCDGRVGFAGGINVGDEYLRGGARRTRWRDTHARIEGPAVLRLQEVFAEDWYFTTSRDLLDSQHFPEPEAAGDELVQVLASGPDQPWEVIHRILFTAITQAEHSVLITTPYLIPDQAMQVALQTAALRGVDVRILIPRRSDHRLIDYAARSFLPELIAAGVRVFAYGAGMMHAKTAVVDGVWSTVGSANMDIRSFRLNFEANLVVYGRNLAMRLTDVIEADLLNATEIRLASLKRRPYRDRVLEGACRILSPVL